MNLSTLTEILKIRLLIGFLGEKAQFGWWPTSFYEASGRLFLEPVFSKTSRLAQYHGVLEAARRIHDEHLSVGSYHLFRLPEEVEQDLHALIQSGAADEFALEGLSNQEAALSQLAAFAGSTQASSVGPTAIGSVNDLQESRTAQAIAAAYLSAFNVDAKTYPYLVG